MLNLIIPDWPAPPWIKAATTTRRGGFSAPPFDSLNVSLMVGDNADDVAQNRKLLKNSLENLSASSGNTAKNSSGKSISENFFWLQQVHGNKAISADSAFLDPIADAIYTQDPHVACAVQTADCLPLLVCSRTHHCIAAIHAGWKGLANGIIENSIGALDCAPDNLLVWLGPAIGPQAFVVGPDVVNTFTEKSRKAKAAFQDIGNNHWRANLYQLAKQRLNNLGIQAIYGGHYCTYTDKDNFFSFRRDKVTGRMASLIWISPSNT